MSQFRIGYGYDAHRFAEGRPLILCGVEIPYERGLAGHSDADAAAHALTDALLGALQRPKIFPFVPAMRERLASALGIGTDQVSIKGKTTEGMGFCGRGEGVEAYAAALLERK